MSLVIEVCGSGLCHRNKLRTLCIESTLHPGLVNNPLITIIPLPPPPSILRANSLPFILAAPLKVLWQIWSLFHVLGYGTKPARWLLVQVEHLSLLLTVADYLSAEPSLDSHALYCSNNMLPTKYSPDNRLA